LRRLSLLGLLILLPGAAEAVVLTRGPYLQLGTESGVVLRWRTDTPTDSQVLWGDAPGSLSNAELLGASTTEHEVPISGLAAATRYYYSVGSSTEVLAGGNANYYFDTSPLAGTATASRVWVLGDSGTASSSAAAVRDAFLAYPAAEETDLVVMLGDNAYSDGTDAEYQAGLFDMYPSVLRTRVFWPAFGNHDGHSADSATESGPYYDNFTLPRAGEAGGVASGTEAYYSFDYANIHFVCLDSYDSDRSLTGAMLTWMVQDLAATTQDWIIAFWHHPPYSKGSHDSDSEMEQVDMRENAVELLEDAGADLVLAGHSHAYERSFLIDGHYGDSTTFAGSMQLDAGDGREAGDGAYDKAAMPHEGTVYVVAGTSAKTSGGALDHPAMFLSLNELGSMVLDVSGNRLDAVFLRDDGTTPDHFTILKGPDLYPPHILSARGTSATTVEVEFNEPLTPLVAEEVEHYSVESGALVLSATLLGDGRTVELGVTPLSKGASYLLGVSGVTDIAANPLSPAEQISFSWLDPVTVSFQDGVSPDAGYAGTRDTYLEQAAPDANQGSATALLVDGDDGGGSDLTSLVRWDLEAIPASAILDGASIEIDVFNASSDSYELYALLVPWAEDEATWNESATGLAWGSAGASGAGDRGGEVLGVVHAGATGAYEVVLNAAGLAEVQGWVADPTSNRGLALADSDENDGLDFSSREAPVTGARPKLTVTYHELAVPDGEPPSIPAALEVTAIGTDFVHLGWQASTDNVVVAFYVVYRDGGEIGSTTGTTWADATVAAGSLYDYQVEAIDPSGNPSGLSSSVPAMTPEACGAADGDTLVLEMETVTDERLYEVCSAITLQNDYAVTAPGSVTLRTGGRALFGSGFSVGLGSSLAVEIDPAL
jgi:predicted phosphodiesterase